MKDALLWAGGVVVLQVLVLILGMHLVLNHTPSLPEGLYWRLGMPPTLARGDLVELTPPDGVFAVLQQQPPPRITTMLKRIGAVGGDKVCWNHGTMSAEGRWWHRSPIHPLADGVLGCVTL